MYINIVTTLKFYVLLTVHPCIIFCKKNQRGAQIFLICLLLFSTCFGQLCAHHREKIPYLCDTWYLSLYIYDWYAGRSALHTSHLYRVTNTRCRKGTIFSPDDGHIIPRNMQRKTINILRKFVHQVGPIYKTLQLYKQCIKTDTIVNKMIHKIPLKFYRWKIIAPRAANFTSKLREQLETLRCCCFCADR